MHTFHTNRNIVELGYYPRRLHDLATAIGHHDFPRVSKKFIYEQRHPD
jgi:hypothetical protein